MSDEHVSQEPARDAGASTAQKPKYEAPAIVDLTGPGYVAGAYCDDGSAAANCWHGSGAPTECVEGPGF